MKRVWFAFALAIAIGLITNKFWHPLNSTAKNIILLTTLLCLWLVLYSCFQSNLLAAADLIVLNLVLVVLFFKCSITPMARVSSKQNVVLSNQIVVRPPNNYKAPVTDKAVRIGMACMTKNPIAFRTWLKHHKRIGVEHFFIRVEDSPDVKELLSSEPWSGCTTVTYSKDEDFAYFSQMNRQSQHINESITRARHMGLTHLIHIDDDELIYCAAGVNAFHAHLGLIDADCIKMRNIEAVYDKSDCDNPFESTRTFCVLPTMFTSYANGKSIGRLRSPTLQAHGPHMFTGLKYNIPSYVAVVIHYESSCFERWKHKFSSYATDSHSPNACKTGKIPFKYFCESMEHVNDNTAIDVWTRWKTTGRHSDLVTIDKVVE